MSGGIFLQKYLLPYNVFILVQYWYSLKSPNLLLQKYYKKDQSNDKAIGFRFVRPIFNKQISLNDD
jgi:hypothetical protein